MTAPAAPAKTKDDNDCGGHRNTAAAAAADDDDNDDDDLDDGRDGYRFVSRRAEGERASVPQLIAMHSLVRGASDSSHTR